MQLILHPHRKTTQGHGSMSEHFKLMHAHMRTQTYIPGILYVMRAVVHCIWQWIMALPTSFTEAPLKSNDSHESTNNMIITNETTRELRF